MTPYRGENAIALPQPLGLSIVVNGIAPRGYRLRWEIPLWQRGREKPPFVKGGLGGFPHHQDGSTGLYWPDVGRQLKDSGRNPAPVVPLRVYRIQ